MMYKEADGSGNPVPTVYCCNVVYENSVGRLLLTEEGYVTLSDKKYHYYLQDHQGNNRVVLSSSGAVEEANHYYPFGGVFASSGNVQPYKYNGKEYDGKKGLNFNVKVNPYLPSKAYQAIEKNNPLGYIIRRNK